MNIAAPEKGGASITAPISEGTYVNNSVLYLNVTSDNSVFQSKVMSYNGASRLRSLNFLQSGQFRISVSSNITNLKLEFFNDGGTTIIDPSLLAVSFDTTAVFSGVYSMSVGNKLGLRVKNGSIVATGSGPTIMLEVHLL